MTIYNARELATMLGISEKTVRRRIANGEIVAVKVAPNRWAIEGEGMGGGKEGTEQLALRLRALEEKVERISGDLQKMIEERERERIFSAPEIHVPISPPREFLAIAKKSYASLPSFGDEFLNRAECARFLELHGVNPLTSKHWHDCPMTRLGAVEYVLEHKVKTGYRSAAIHLVKCGDINCPCQDVL